MSIGQVVRSYPPFKGAYWIIQRFLVHYEILHLSFLYCSTFSYRFSNFAIAKVVAINPFNSFSHILSLSLFPSFSHSLTHSLSLSFTHSLSLPHIIPLSVSLLHTLSFSLLCPYMVRLMGINYKVVNPAY